MNEICFWFWLLVFVHAELGAIVWLVRMVIAWKKFGYSPYLLWRKMSETVLLTLLAMVLGPILMFEVCFRDDLRNWRTRRALKRISR